MVKIYLKQILVSSLILLSSTFASAQQLQLPNAGFEDWSGAEFDGNIQPASWNASNVSQLGLVNVNFAHREKGHSGSYSMMVQDQEVGAAGITEVSPGYFSLGKPWVYVKSIAAINQATAGTSGGITWKYRPDTMSVWIKRTGSNVDKEDFYLLYYAWSGTAKGSKYTGKDGSCASVSQTNEESDIRLALNGNECGTDQKANQIAEGMWREKKTYGEWTNIRVPIYYFNNEVPTMMNIIFSASNYPNFRANSGLYAGNSLYVDDVELIYSSKIQTLFIGGKEWKAFDPNSTEEQTYSLGTSATVLPTEFKAFRGVGSLTNARGNTVNFAGRELSGDEISIKHGEIDGAPTEITVKSEDGKSISTYKIKFVRAASTNAKLKNIFVNGMAISNFQPFTYTYTYSLPYGTKALPEISVETQEEKQTVEITQTNSLTGTATIKVTAADKKTTSNYTINFNVALLADNTLKDIKVNGVSVAGFTPSQTIYRVSLPTSTTAIPEVEAVSAYPAGEQTIVHTKPTSVTNLHDSKHIISVTTPGNQVAKKYTLTYKLEASSYSLLKSLQMGEDLIKNFDPNTFTYYVNLPIGTTTLPKITYEKGESTQNVTVQEGGLNGISKVIVVAGNGVDQSEYKIVVTTDKSTISTLDMIYLDGVALNGFAPNKKSYTYQLPIGTTTLPTITYDKGDEYQTVVVTTPSGLTGTARIAVTAEDGNSTIYQITFSVAKATNATLKMIYLDGQPLVGYDPNVLEYNCPLPQGTLKLPVITYDKGDEYQTVTVRDGGINGDYKITVRPQSGASQTYTLHFSVATSDNADLKMIYLDGRELDGFNPNILNYIDTLPMGVLTIPEVTFDKGDVSQKVLSIRSNNVQTIKVTAESGKTKTYTITFIIQRSNSAFLKMIYLDGVALEGFDKNTFDYTVSLKTATCPKITVDKEDGQQVTITAPYSTGLAKIVVTPEGAASNTYTINFINLSNNYALLKNISVDGTPITGFNPELFTYEVTGKHNSVITYEKADSTQMVTEFRQGNKVTLYVAMGTHKAQYEITLLEQVNVDCTLHNITMNGATIAGFSPKTLVYNLPITADTIPTIGYEKQYAEQVVYAGMLNANTYSLLVVAQSGDTARYVLNFDKQLSDDANLIDMQLQEDYGVSIVFQPNTYEYTVTLAEGYDLPYILVESKPGQNVELHAVSNAEQQVIVTAPSGKTNVYRISYNRTKSTNAYLADILVDGVSLDGFDSEVYTYTDTLAWRTKVVPCVQPIGSHPDQVITTYHSSVNGTTMIHVVAADGTSTQDYSIQFPVVKSSNVALEYIEIDHESVRIDYQPTVTDYTILLPYGETTAPLVLYKASEPEQNIEYISRPFGQTSEIKVIAENGDQRTYKLHFQPTYASQANLLKSLSIVETGSPLDVETSSHTVALPYGTRTMTVNFTKTFAEQTVWVQPGGIQSPTVITVKSNRPEEADVVYTITPQVAAQDPATLTDIQVNGTTIEGFDPNRFSYIANVVSKPSINTTAFNGANVIETIDTDYHWQAKVTANGRTNYYDIWYYYFEDVIPNGEFTQWTKTAKSNTDKPTSWNVPGDYLNVYAGTAKAGITVNKTDASTVHLQTTYWGALMGPVPAIMNLGDMNGAFAVAGGTRVTPSGFIKHYNSPDNASIRYRYKDKAGNGALFRFKFFDNKGNEYSFDHIDTQESSEFKVVNLPLSTQDKNITGLDIIIDATGKYPTASSNANLYVDYVRFSYNSTLTGLKVNDSIAHMDGNTFSYTLPDSENTLLPTLTFTGEVADQAQKVVWSNEIKEAGYGVRNATITNYAEDGSSTEYTLQVKRPLDTKNTLSDLKLNGTTIAAFIDTKTEYTVHLASTTKHLPDVQPVAASCLQTITTSYADSVMTIVVTPELGEATTYTVRFITDLSDDTELENITVEGMDIAFAPAQKEYTITATQLPDITFVKKMDGQTVDVKDGVLHVTAENGATGTYTIVLNQPAINTTGQLSMIEVNGVDMQGFNSSTYEYTLNQPELVGFKRMHESDSVVFVQTPLYMEWQVYGDEQHTYRINYPNELSSNTYLKAIYLDSTLYVDFNEKVYDYVYKTDNPIHVHAIANDKASHLEATYAIQGDTLIYTYIVTAEDGTVGNPYTFTIVPDLSNTAFLQSITLDGAPIQGFRADSLNYTIVVPTGVYKVVEPTMPSIGYQLGAPRQQVNIEHGGLGQTTNIEVIAEDGSAKSLYQLHVEAEPSHCVALTGIAVNGKPIEHFESGRHYYSVESTEDVILLTYSSNDNFQTITQIDDQYSHTLHVVAQDGVSTSDYVIEVYRKEVSNDVTLANILLDGQTFDVFEHTLNPDLEFSSMQQKYNIHLPSGTQHLPEVSALLNSEGQTVEITTKDWTVEIKVTAPDKVSTNTYTLRFSAPKSSNAQLKMIYVGTDTLANFAPDRYHYFIDLPVGQASMPEILVITQEEKQQYIDSITGPLQHTIYVTAEDGVTTQQYLLAFQRTYSNIDTLSAIYEDGITIAGFRTDSFQYAYTLPVGTEFFPVLSWKEGDNWQTITTDTVMDTPTKRAIQINVVAESGSKNTYIVAYEILQSSVDTLQMISIGATPIQGFEAHTLEYYINLAPGDSIAPNVAWQEGDPYQLVTSNTTAYTINNVQLGWKTTLNVQAQDGHVRTYNIYFLFSKVLSTNTYLSNIYLNGEPMSNFDPSVHMYRITVPLGEKRPSVLATTAEPTQTIILAQGDTTTITVIAEDTTFTDIYTLLFDYQQSPYAYLAGIYQDGELIEGFRADSIEYHITLPYGTSTLPHFTYEIGIEGQVVQVDTINSTNTKGQTITCYSFIVIAPDEQTSVQYDVYVTVAFNHDCSLQTLQINGVEITGFHADTTAYQIIYPVGTDSAFLATVESITAIANDANATVLISNDGYNFTITVTAHDGIHARTYTIEQIILLSNNTRLAAIYIDGVLLREFNPECLEYTYYVGDIQPFVEALAEDSTSIVDYGLYTADEPYHIYVTAEDGSEQIYTIHFIASTIQTAGTPSANDVIIKYLGNMTFGAASLRKNVSIAVYTGDGHQIFLSKLEETNQNDAIIGTNTEGKDCLMDVHTTSTQFTLPETNQMFFYVFLENGERRITSGKLIVIP